MRDNKISAPVAHVSIDLDGISYTVEICCSDERYTPIIISSDQYSRDFVQQRQQIAVGLYSDIY